jgi:Type II secretion system (T2SS), protein E, N-terminal domain
MKTLPESWADFVSSRSSIYRGCANPECNRARLPWHWTRAHRIRMGDSWFCTSDCLEDELRRAIRRCIEEEHDEPLRWRRMPLGLLMLSRGFVHKAQVQAALLTQREEQCDKIGQWLQRLGFATERQVVTALGIQYATPVLAFPAEIVPQRILPIELLKSLPVMPVRLSTSQHLLYIAFCSPVDHTLLQSIEKMTDYRTSGVPD